MLDINQEVLKRLIALRKNHRLTQKQIAQKSGLSLSYINKLENGHVIRLKINTVLSYLDACKVDYGDFFTELERFISKKRYEQMMSEIDFPKDYQLRKKVSRDIAIYHTKIKGKSGKAKPLSKQAQHKAVVKFGNYRAKIEHIQSLAYKIISKHAPSTTLNPFYRAFVNEIYKKLKKNYLTNFSLDNGFDSIIQRWVKKGLKEEVLKEIKDVIVKYFEPEKQG